MKKRFLLLLITGLFVSFSSVFAQPWTYNFGTGTGSYTTASGVSTTFFSGTPSGGGTYRLRCATTGNVGAGFVLSNSGTSLGTGTELQINASATASTQKFTVFGWSSPSNTAYVKYKFRNTSAAAGVLAFHLGNGATVPFQDATAYNSYNASLAVLWITYSGGSISSISRRGSGTTTAISSSGIAKDTDQTIEVYGNNNSTTTTYDRSGSYSLNAQSWDLWVDGTKISPSGGWPVAGSLAPNTTLGGFGFFGESSNSAFMYIDDLEYSNALPVALCTAPSTQASDFSFSGITTTALDVNWTNGDGAGRVVVMNNTNSFTAPTTGQNPTADLSWNNSGQQVIYNGTGGGSITVTDLTPGETYYFRAYEYCSPDRIYNTGSASNNPASQATISGPGLSATALASFGAQCPGFEYGPNTFTINGTSLTTENISVSALAGFTFSTSEFGTYQASLDLTQPGGTSSQTIWVKFNPIASVSYNGNIVVSGGGATAINVAASGSGLTGEPVIGSPTSASITSTTATLGGNITSIGCSAVTERGIYWSLVNGFANGTGTEVNETGSFGTGAFTVPVTGLPSNTLVYYKAYAINGADTAFTAQQSFTTLQFFLNVSDIAIVGWNCNTTDDFDFVTWVDLPNNVIIKFTDNGFNGVAPNSENTAANARGTEGFVIWRNNTGTSIAAGTVISITGLTASIGVATGGTASVGLDGGIASGGDQIFAYQGNATTGGNPDFAGTGVSTTFSGDMLFGLHFQGSGSQPGWRTGGTTTSNDSYLPTELNVANANIAFGAAISHGQYTGTRVGESTIAGYKALVSNPANWTTGTGATNRVTLNTAPFIVSVSTATKIVVTNVNNGVTPTQGQPFTISFETRDALDVVTPVSQDTDFSVSVFTGTGVLSGVFTGTIPDGSSTLTISGLLYSVAETGVVLSVQATAGDVLTAVNSNAFTVGEPASNLVMVGVQTFAYTANSLVAFTVEARRPNNIIDTAYTANVTLELFSGTGILVGTLVKPCINGTAFFTGISFDTQGIKQIRAVSGILTPAISASITVSTPSVTDVLVPQYMQGRAGTNSNRIPVAYRVRINGLEANKTFRYYNLMDTLATSTAGAGVILIANQSGNFTRATSGSFTTAGSYGEFTTDINGSYTGWFVTEPSGNDRFTAGKFVYGKILINDPSQGTGIVARVTTNNSIKVLDLGTGASQGTAIRGSSSAAAKNFITMYDNIFGSGRPIACTFVESDGTDNTSGNNYAAFYSTSVNGVNGAYGTIIPNALPNGIRRVEQRSLQTGFFVSCPVTDSDGVWPGGANTVNPNGGTTARVLTSADTPFDPQCVFITFGNNDNFLNASLVPSTGGNYPNSNCYSNTLVGTSVSAEGSTTTVLPAGGQDRWYAVVAPSSVLRVVTSSLEVDLVIELHAANGALIDSQNTVSGIGGETMTTTGLTPGQYYFVAIRSYDGVLGSFTACIQSVLASQVAGGTGTYDLCGNLKSQWTGANSYTYTFTGTGATPVGPTTITSTGQIALSNPILSLQYGGTYNVRIDANYTSLSEPVVVTGTPVAITIAPHALLDVKETQKCPATLLRGTILNAKPYVCSATNFTVSFQRVSACTGGSYIDPVPFEVNTVGASSNLYLNFTSPQQLVAQSWYEVRWRPNFSYGTGTYGPPSRIFIGGAATEEVQSDLFENENVKSDLLDSDVISVYPNPNNGQLMNVNITGVESDRINVRLLDAVGREVWNQSYAVSGSLNTSLYFGQALRDGFYIIEFNDNGKIRKERIVVQQ